MRGEAVKIVDYTLKELHFDGAQAVATVVFKLDAGGFAQTIAVRVRSAVPEGLPMGKIEELMWLQAKMALSTASHAE